MLPSPPNTRQWPEENHQLVSFLWLPVIESLCNLDNITNLCDFYDRAMRTSSHFKQRKKTRNLKDPDWIIPKVSPYLFSLRTILINYVPYKFYWCYVIFQTRRQPPGSNLCGFYILRHIYNIIAIGRTDLMKEVNISFIYFIF